MEQKKYDRTLLAYTEIAEKHMEPPRDTSRPTPPEHKYESKWHGDGTERGTWCPTLPMRSYMLYVAYFFTVNGATATLFPYLSVYYKQLGFDAKHIGILASVQSWIAIPFAPLAGYITDKYAIRKIVLGGSLVSAAVCHMALNFVPRVRRVDCDMLCTNRQQELNQDPLGVIEIESDVMIRACNTTYNSNETPLHRSDMFNNSSFVPWEDCSGYYGYLYNSQDLDQLFIYLIAVNIICQLLGSAWSPLGNALVLDSLGPERRNQYAYFKGFGSISAALGIWSAGQLLEYTNYTSLHCGITVIYANFFVCFALFFVLMLMALPIAMAMSPNKVVESVPKEYHFADVLQSLCNARYGSVLIAIIWLAIVNGKMRTFDFWYIEFLGGSHSLMAWGGGLGGLAMALTFFVLPPFTDKFGHVSLVILTCLITGVGCAISALAKKPVWMMIPLCLRGVATAMYMQTSGAYFAGAIDSHQQATMQTIMASINFGIGRGVGSLLGGGLFTSISPARSYVIFAVVSFAAGIALFSFHVVLKLFSKCYDKRFIKGRWLQTAKPKWPRM